MIGLIDAIITVFPALLVISIVLSVPIAFASLWALKMAHKAENRRIQNLQGRHIRRSRSRRPRYSASPIQRISDIFERRQP